MHDSHLPNNGVDGIRPATRHSDLHLQIMGSFCLVTMQLDFWVYVKFQLDSRLPCQFSYLFSTERLTIVQVLPCFIHRVRRWSMIWARLSRPGERL
jgi:hypothetical protein